MRRRTFCSHPTLGTSCCSWVNQDTALTLLSANNERGSRELNQAQGPPELGPSRSTLPSGSLKEFGDISYPFLASPMSGPKGEDTAFTSPREGQRPAGLWYQGLTLVQMGNGDQLVLRGFWVTVGLKGAFTPDQPAQDGSREPGEGLRRGEVRDGQRG